MNTVLANSWSAGRNVVTLYICNRQLSLDLKVAVVVYSYASQTRSLYRARTSHVYML